VPIPPLAVRVSVEVATPELDTVKGLKLQERPEAERPAHERESDEGFKAVPLLVPMVSESTVWLDWATTIARDALLDVSVYNGW
jgi:hypothetical protein